jgi:hypothetical protein
VREGHTSEAWIATAFAQRSAESIRVNLKGESRESIRNWMPGSGIENYVASATIEAVKPIA